MDCHSWPVACMYSLLCHTHAYCVQGGLTVVPRLYIHYWVHSLIVYRCAPPIAYKGESTVVPRLLCPAYISTLTQRNRRGTIAHSLLCKLTTVCTHYCVHSLLCTLTIVYSHQCVHSLLCTLTIVCTHYCAPPIACTPRIHTVYTTLPLAQSIA